MKSEPKLTVKIVYVKQQFDNYRYPKYVDGVPRSHFVAIFLLEEVALLSIHF